MIIYKMSSFKYVIQNQLQPIVLNLRRNGLKCIICDVVSDSQHGYIWHEQGGDGYVHGVPGFRYFAIEYMYLSMSTG